MTFNTLISILAVGTTLLALIFSFAERIGRKKSDQESVKVAEDAAEENLPPPADHAEAVDRAHSVMNNLGVIPLADYASNPTVRKNVDEALEAALKHVREPPKESEDKS